MNVVNRWTDSGWAERYLADRGKIPHRLEAYASLVEMLPPKVERVLDLGTGDGCTLALVIENRPFARGFGLDFNPAMLHEARTTFADNDRVAIVEHDLDNALPTDLGQFDLIVSSFAIHHCVADRQRALYGEVFDLLTPGGVFANLEHVASATPKLHVAFLAALGIAEHDDDPSNKLVEPEVQLGWLRSIGFADVDCLWRWRELALLMGTRPTH